MQHNITCILHINSSNKMFCSIHDFTFLVTDTKIKGQVSFESPEKKKLLPAWFSVKFVMLPAQSITLANWFACIPACTSAIVQVSLTSLIMVLKFHTSFKVTVKCKTHFFLGNFLPFRLKTLRYYTFIITSAKIQKFFKNKFAIYYSLKK